MGAKTGILFSFHSCSSGFETNSLQEFIEAGEDASVEAVKLGAVGVVQLAISAEWSKQTGSQRSIDAFKEFEEDHADGVALGEQSIAARARDFLNQTFSPELGQVVAQ